MKENWKPIKSAKNKDKKDLSDLKNIIKETPISHIVSRYLEIKRSGSNLVSLCPFHSDGHPSLSISDKMNFFKCFACNTSGDAITFVELFKKVTFIEALKEIAELLGLDFGEYNEEKEKDPRQQMALKVLKRSTQIYRKLSLEILKDIYLDFIKKRGLSIEIAEKFELGISPYGNLITDYLNSISDSKEKNFALDIATEIHLIRKSHKGPSTYDSFHERIMFPIWNGQGAVIGYTSRALKDDQQPKYLNSSESFIFAKGQILYGLHLARAAIREKKSVIVCEGNMDLISLHQHGFENSVAIMGVGMSMKAIKNLKTITTNFYLALDSDDAGKKAMRNILPLLLEENINPKILDFTPHKDPDDFLRKEGALALHKMIEEARYFLDIVLNALVPEDKNSLTSERKISLLHNAFEILSPIRDNLLASEKMIEFAKNILLKSDPQILTQQFFEYLSQKNKKNTTLRQSNKAPSKNTANMTSKNFSSQEQIETINYPKNTEEKPWGLSRTELEILKISLEYPQTISHHLFVELLDFVTHNEVKIYLGKLRELGATYDYVTWPNTVLNTAKELELNMPFQQTLSSILWNLESLWKGRDKNVKPDEDFILRYFSDIKKCFKEDQLKMRRKILIDQQKNALEQSDVDKILIQIQEIAKELRNLKQSKIFKEV